jgi:uncharacterized protein
MGSNQLPVNPRWTPRFPEVAAVANAVSLAMPHVEPFVIKAVRRVEGAIADPALQAEVVRFVREEASHHAAHRRFNDQMLQAYPHLRLTDRLIAWMVRRVGGCSASVGTGFAAGFEMAGLAVVHWLAPRADLLFRDADRQATDLFLWHLAEEMDHREVAADVHRAAGGGTGSYIVGLFLALIVLATSAIGGSLTILVKDRRWWRPVAWWRLLCWGTGFLWMNGPMFLESVWRHPRYFSVPLEAHEWRDRHQPGAVHSDVRPDVCSAA